MFLFFGRNPLVSTVVALAGAVLLAIGIDRGKAVFIIVGAIALGRGALSLAQYWRRGRVTRR
ncbi:MAG TPA: hypothetical protein VGJ07_03810 [Rugosimonospora sp.]|jgi:hypothetical protein